MIIIQKKLVYKISRYQKCAERRTFSVAHVMGCYRLSWVCALINDCLGVFEKFWSVKESRRKFSSRRPRRGRNRVGVAVLTRRVLQPPASDSTSYLAAKQKRTILFENACANINQIRHAPRLSKTPSCTDKVFCNPIRLCWWSSHCVSFAFNTHRKCESVRAETGCSA